MSYIEGTAREQYILFPEVINEYITEDNPVRFIDAFVDTLDLEEMGFARCQPAATGRPGYDPATTRLISSSFTSMAIRTAYVPADDWRKSRIAMLR
jgi:transposase